MEFKIDTKTTYEVITPITNSLNANLTEALGIKLEELTKNGSKNFIIDLHNCLNADNESLKQLAQLHELCYNNHQSLVFTNLQEDIAQILQKEDIADTINVAPTMIEAVDIISMEILERDLFNEE